MWRYLVGGAAALVLALGGMFLFRGSASPETKPTPRAAAVQQTAADAPLPDVAPSADARTREQKRFDRVDKDRDNSITRDEYFTQRKKAFAKLDTNHDGKLSFEEWAIRGITRFNTADKDHSGTLNRVEFATTALKRRAPSKARCDCQQQARSGTPPTPGAGDEEE